MKKLVVANWKCNPKTVAEAKRLFAAAQKSAAKAKNVEVVVCPPFPFISLLNPTGNLKLGAQNCFWQAEGGPYTGEVSPAMLKNLGCEYVILGHSERRRLFGETNEIINKKLQAVLKAGLKPLLFLGETEKQKDEKAFDVLKNQLEKILSHLTIKPLSHLTVVYEPAFAISTAGGKPLLPKEVVNKIVFLRKLLREKFGSNAKELKVLYGGSVNEKNAGQFIAKAGVDGLVIGEASLNALALDKIVCLCYNKVYRVYDPL